MKSYELKFEGDFSIMEELGFRFCKLYAAEYPVWIKKQEPHSVEDILIFEDNREVVLCDFLHYSGNVFNFLLNNQKNKPKLDMWILSLNNQTGEVHYKTPRFDAMLYFLRDENDDCWKRIPQHKKDQMIPDISCNDFDKIYRELTIHQSFFDEVCHLFDKKLFRLISKV